MQTCKAEALVRVAQFGLAGKCEFGLQSVALAHKREIPAAAASEGTPQEFAHCLPPCYQKEQGVKTGIVSGWMGWSHGIATH